MKVLLVDDDTDLLDVTAYALRREGMTVLMATNGAQALQRWQAEQPDVVVLDVQLPRVHGFEVCRAIAEEGKTPVILLSGLAGDEHVVQGFRSGADDYVTKPFSPRELAIRIRAICRRSMGHTNVAMVEPRSELRVNDLVLDLESHEVTLAGRTVRLTPTEFRLLYILAMNAGRVVASARLVEYAWGYAESDISLLRGHLSHIRSKLGLRHGGPGEIVAVSGVGYSLKRTAPARLDAPETPAPPASTTVHYQSAMAAA
jgi:DNA-binding response OmpR family regulator